MAKKTNTDKQRITLPRSVKRLFPNVTAAFDADHAVEISVQRKDCKEGKKLNPSECALARAARRELKADGVIIGMSSSYIIKEDIAIRFATPESVARELVSFDRHQDFAPGDYYLTPKAPANRFGQYTSGSHKTARKNTKRKLHSSARVRILPHGVDKS
jgi:hypothetical protein